MDMDRPVCNTNQHLVDTLTYRAGLLGVYADSDQILEYTYLPK